MRASDLAVLALATATVQAGSAPRALDNAAAVVASRTATQTQSLHTQPTASNSLSLDSLHLTATSSSAADASDSTLAVTASHSTGNATNATSTSTSTDAGGLSGAAIPQQMQSSMAGLLGFCIMGLIMI